MGREVRRVPMNWEHPRDERGTYIPLREGYSSRLADWSAARGLWAGDTVSFVAYYGECPDALEYMPEWSDEEAIGWQMYEDTSDGTPISPVMESPEALARWLDDNNASAFGDMTATYAGWLQMIYRGWAPSMVMANGVISSGVEYTAQHR